MFRSLNLFGFLVLAGLHSSQSLEEETTLFCEEVRNNTYGTYRFIHAADEKNFEKYPLVIWISDGFLRSSSIDANFGEIGPRWYNGTKRERSWHTKANLLFIDTPVGSGDSYVTSTDAFATSDDTIVKDLQSVIYKFFKKYPNLLAGKVHIFGETYGAKIAAKYALKNINCSIQNCPIDISSVNLINPWIEPKEAISNWPVQLIKYFELPLAKVSEISDKAFRVRTLIKKGNWTMAFKEMQNTIIEIRNAVGNIDFGNLKRVGENTDLSEMFSADNLIRLMNETEISLLKHFPCIFWKIREDYLKPAVSEVEQLLSLNYMNVNIISGERSLLAPEAAIHDTIYRMSWSGGENSENFQRIIFRNLFTQLSIEISQRPVVTFRYYVVHNAGQTPTAENEEATYKIFSEIIKVEDIYIEVEQVN